jgi:hypothetical protein
MIRSLWSSRRYFSSDVSAVVPIRVLRGDTHGPRPSEPSDPESKGSPSNWWAFTRLGFFTGELSRKQHIKALVLLPFSGSLKLIKYKHQDEISLHIAGNL